MSSVTENARCKKFSGLYKVNEEEEEVTNYLGNLVWDSVEEMLNTLLEAKADELTKAKHYKRSPEWVDKRAGHGECCRHRSTHTRTCTWELQIPVHIISP